MSNINGFLDNFLGGARSDLFEFWLVPPTAIDAFQSALEQTAGHASLEASNVVEGNNANSTTATNTFKDLDIFGTSNGGYLKYMAKSAVLPKSGVNTTDVSYKGRTFPYSTNRNDDNSFSITFYNDTHFKLRNTFELWIQQMRLTQQNYGQYPASLMGSGQTFQQDQLTNVLKTYNFYNIFPTEVSNIDLSWEGENIEEFTVTFSYHYHTTDTTDIDMTSL
jgi:hypothetical protein